MKSRLVFAVFVLLLALAPLVLPEFSITLLNYIGLYALVALGLAPMEAQGVAAAIVDWRSGAPTATGFDQQYLSMVPSFRAPHASMEQIEDLLSVHGVSPELYYGRYMRTPQGDLIVRAGLKDCLSVYSSGGALDVNTAAPETMLIMPRVTISGLSLSRVVKRPFTAPIRPPRTTAASAASQD
jgi:hypothetical protein